MVTIRCPQCGMSNRSDDIGYPRCGQCHDDLARCIYCRRHEGSACTHPTAHVRYRADGEAAKTCPAFHSRYEERTPGFFAHLPAPIWVALLLLLVVCGLGTLSWAIDPSGRYFRGSELELLLLLPKQVVRNVPFSIVMRVANSDVRASAPFYIEIDESYLAGATVGKPTPSPLRVIPFRSANRLLFEYPPLLPGEQVDIRFPITQRSLSAAPFIARLYSPINHLNRVVDIPIAIDGNRGSGTKGGALQ